MMRDRMAADFGFIRQVENEEGELAVRLGSADAAEMLL